VCCVCVCVYVAENVEYSIDMWIDILNNKSFLGTERDCFYYIIVQSYDVGSRYILKLRIDLSNRISCD